MGLDINAFAVSPDIDPTDMSYEEQVDLQLRKSQEKGELSFYWRGHRPLLEFFSKESKTDVNDRTLELTQPLYAKLKEAILAGDMQGMDDDSPMNLSVELRRLAKIMDGKKDMDSNYSAWANKISAIAKELENMEHDVQFCFWAEKEFLKGNRIWFSFSY